MGNKRKKTTAHLLKRIVFQATPSGLQTRPFAFIGLGWVAMALTVWAAAGCNEKQKKSPRAGAQRAASGQDTPIEKKSVLKAYSAHHAAHLKKLGHKTKQLFGKKPTPAELKAAARYFESAAAALQKFAPAGKHLGPLLKKRAALFLQMTTIWKKLAQHRAAGDEAAYARDVRKLIEKRAQDLFLRKKIRRLYRKQDLEPPV